MTTSVCHSKRGIRYTNKLVLEIVVLEVNFGLFDGREDGEHNGVGLEEIGNIFVIQGDVFIGIIWQNIVHLSCWETGYATS